MEPKRLLIAGSPTARLLLREAKRDEPPPSLVPALLGSVGLATVWLPIGGKLVMAIRHAAISKISVGIVAMAAAGGSVYVMSRIHERAPRAEVSQRPSATVGSTGAVQVPATEQPRAVAQAVEISPATSSTTTGRSTPRVDRPVRRHGVAAPAPTVAASATPSILVELDDIRHVRSLVEAGNGDGALAALDAYVSSHPRRTFEEEALALRVRALRLTGDLIGAERGLHTLETRFPNSVHLAPLEP